MAKYKVTLASKARDYTFNGRDGEEVAMVEYQVAVTDEAGTQTLAKMSRSAKKPAPVVGDEINGTITQSEKFGIELKEDRQGGGGRGGYQRSPEETASIIRQNSLGHATDIMIAVARMTYDAAEDKQKGLAEAKEFLKPQKVFALSELYFLQAAGNLAVASSSQPATAPAVTPETKDAVTASFPEAADQVDDEPVDPAKHTKDVSPSDIPF
jgi:hypothetical protein